ncbi:MAG: hypothetical protein ACO3RV_03300 [Luteolibacter sp.]
MHIFQAKQPLAWGQLDLPLLGLSRDWDGNAIDPPAAFSLADDGRHLWFVAHHRSPASIHPTATPGRFMPELWQYDCAELFLGDPASGRYLEFNLAPNSAWWSCEFTAPRSRAEEIDIAMPDVATFAELTADGAWLVAMAIPTDLLRARLNYGSTSTANVTFILGSPNQKFISAANMGDGPLDFHQPEKFPTVSFTPIPSM